LLGIPQILISHVPLKFWFRLTKIGGKQRMNKSGAEGSMWLVSSNPFDVVGARAVGMKVAWVDRAGNGWQDRLGDGPTVVVKGLGEVADAVEKYAKGQL
jgi:hypothetical protein